MIRPLSARLTAVVAALGLICSPAADAAEPEDELKAAIVLAFLRYTDWPPTAHDGPIAVCVAGRTSFAQLLRRTAAGKTVNNRPVQVIDFNANLDMGRCQAAYFATENKLDLQQMLPAAGASHLLTIGESKDFLDSGGAVRLLIVDGHMSFEVNLATLERSGLNIGSKLLRVGQIYGRRKGDT